MTRRDVDVVIAGAGIAGASLACELLGQLELVVLEAETQPGYHSTGRSVALFNELYGPPAVRRLAAASREFLESPPAGFCEHPLMSPRGVLLVAAGNSVERIAVHERHARELGVEVERLTTRQALERVPVLREEAAAAALLQPRASDLDVHALHQGYLRPLRRAGVLRLDAGVTDIEHGHHGWTVRTRHGERYSGRVLVNAAGAWADRIATAAGVAPLGLQARRRTAVTVDAPAGIDVRNWPLVADVPESLYFKPEAGRLLVSPADETPVDAHDVQPEEIDVAIAVDRFMRATTVAVHRIEHRWAGLRVFAPDGVPVAGFDGRRPDFFWLAGQGGYGIQIAPALARLAAATLRDVLPPGPMQQLAREVQPGLNPHRFAAGFA